MTLDQLRMLISIADTGGVLAAAEALHRTQPTVSVAIRKLEAELGVGLLARDQYRARLTPVGEKICVQARKVLSESENLMQLAAYLGNGCEPHLAISIEESCPVPLVLQVLKNLELKYPQTKFELLGERLWGALERLEEGEVDIAITPWFEENVVFETFLLNRVRMIPVAAADFLSADLRGRPLRLAELKGRVQVVVRDSSRVPREKNLGVLPDERHWLVNDHLTKKEILLAGMGWGRLQQHMVQDDLDAGRLVELKIEDFGDRGTIEIRVARRRDMALGPVATDLWTALKLREIKDDEG
ncbi:MAG: LysR family transcriptional regulator [Deltaproteobacteria bacterium]|nr:LysR family transcriptional regulator [Deltaproteobacteria bacterium]NCP02128.1 LysR family transcriptional regulator [Deltaproteobacteria bacterium]